MNPISLYITISRLVFQSDYSEQSWIDLYRLVPYLRQSLSCTVCGNLLVEPYTPKDNVCQHHVCKKCIRGRKTMKPSCNLCKDYEKYDENMTLRILLQCYRSLCEHIMNTPIFNQICNKTKATGLVQNGIKIPSLSIVEFIEEGAKFQDNFKSNSGLSKSAYSILPCLFTNNCNSLISQQQQQQQIQQQVNTSNSNNTLNNLVCVQNSSSINHKSNNYQNNDHNQQKTSSQITHLPPIKTVSNGSAMYSVIYTGIGNKITIKRKTNDDNSKSRQTVRQKTVVKKRGCRCGNATATPGKLTCCGQRCPCYVDQRACLDCKCRGCRNPHRPDGGKIRPHIPELACYEIQMADESENLQPTVLSTNANNCVQIPIEEFETTSPLTSLKGSNGINQTFDCNNQPLLISSAEGNFQVVNLYPTTSVPHQNTHLSIGQNSQLQCHQHDNSHQITELSSTMPQILFHKPESAIPLNQSTTILATTSIGGCPTQLTSIPPGPSNLTGSTITISPMTILNSSNSFPAQIFSSQNDLCNTTTTTSTLCFSQSASNLTTPIMVTSEHKNI